MRVQNLPMDLTPPRMTRPAVNAARMPMICGDTGAMVFTASVIAEDCVVQPTPNAAKRAQRA